MTDLATAPAALDWRRPRTRRYLMTRPDHFEVRYAINPWMNPSLGTDTALAIRQWEQLRATYLELGHRVDVTEPVPGLPDMVYAANGALSTSRATIGARFAYPQRAAEGEAYAQWLEAHGLGPVHRPQQVNEGEGDFLVVGGQILAGTGFRTTPAAHTEVAEVTGLPVISLELIDPHFYHLDTALAVLDDETVAYYPGAFSITSQATLAVLFPDAVIAGEADAAVLGLNAVSDGRHVVLTAAAPGLADALAERGFVPVPLDLSELLKGGGGIKCCTLEIRKVEVAS
jgi:N-dimethylarginine dimethylaminohydrolase